MVAFMLMAIVMINEITICLLYTSFIENDAKLLLQRLPEDVKNVHYHDDETHIRQLLEKYDLVPNRGISLAAATVRGLILTVSHKEQIGELYPQVLETLVYGACRELFE